VRVALELGRLTGTAELLAYDIYHIIQEGLINAARHAGASKIRVAAGAHDDRVDIVVADNGRGFSFHGNFDHAALTALRLGPVIL
jgi:signal transduction histidine kinase